MDNDQLTKELKAHLSRLQELKKYINSQLKSAPAGTINIKNERGKPRFYHHLPNSDKRVYLTDPQLITALIQKEYLSGTLKSLNEELNLINQIISQINTNPSENIISSLDPVRQKYITPVSLSSIDKAFIDKWLIKDTNPYHFAPGSVEHYAADGTRVRSKSEVMIADRLKAFDIPYQYEIPLGSYRPDFRVLRKSTRETVYWEHLGLMDNTDYVNNQLSKIDVYSQNGIILGKNLILTMETSSHPLNYRIIDQTIKNYLL